jgi:peptidoglycan/xylan/chitin deacetylase (PgdA/CDA1 family)
METLARVAEAVRLRDLVLSIPRNTIRRNTVVVTFDDGYVDALTVALPILERYGIPATVFVVSGYVGREFWWDELDRVVSGSSNASKRLTGSAGSTAVMSHAARLSGLPDMERRRTLLALAQANTVSKPEQRALTVEELEYLARHELVEIGAHTVTHPLLPLLSQGEQRCELEDSRRTLESITGRPIFSFAYPHGALSHQTIRLVRQAGYTAACTSTPDVITFGSDLLALPRFWVGDWSGDRFGRFLRRWLLV